MGEEDVLKKLENAESYGNNSNDVLDKEKENNEKKRKKALIISTGVAAALGVTTIFFAANGDDAVRGVLTPAEQQSASRILGNNSTVSGGDASGDNVKSEESSEISADIPEWSALSIDIAQENGDLRRDIFASFANSALRANTYAMPSETNGYHTRGELDDKSVTYTLEEYISTNGEYIERLINPTFGNWSEYQFSNSKASDNFPVDRFSDMFSENFKERHEGIPAADYFPVYADWEENNYGMRNLSNAARWHGEVKNMDSTIENYGDFNEQTNIDATIVFSSWTENGEKVEKEGTLSMVVVPGKESERPLVVEDAVLNVK